MGFTGRPGTGLGGQLGQEGEAPGGGGGTGGRTRRLGLGHRPCVSAHTRKPRAAEPGERVAARLVRRVGGLPRCSPSKAKVWLPEGEHRAVETRGCWPASGSGRSDCFGGRHWGLRTSSFSGFWSQLRVSGGCQDPADERMWL